MSYEYFDPTLNESRRRAIFVDIVAAQDEGVSVADSRELVATQHKVSLDEVRRVEREGIDRQWPPLG